LRVSCCQALEKGLGLYQKLLQDRVGLVDEVDAMRRQNQELRNALNQYLTSGVNQELIVPPTRTIRLGK
jgi:dynein regulatory complex protein 1